MKEVLAALAVLVAAILFAGQRWNRATAQLETRLIATNERADGPASFDIGMLAGLPPPVGRYFAFALTPGQKIVRRAHLQFDGTFAVRPNAWSPFTARQKISAVPPAFVWDARVAMMPIVAVRVRDSYVGGAGSMIASVAGVLPLVSQHGTQEMAAASLQRFLAEAVWIPTALLPRNGLTWSAVDDTTARVTLTDGRTSVWLDVRFTNDGGVETISGLRYRDVNGTPTLTPWIGHHSNYRRIDGMMIPTAGEVAWQMPEGPVAYWRGRLVAARFDQ